MQVRWNVAVIELAQNGNGGEFQGVPGSQIDAFTNQNLDRKACICSDIRACGRGGRVVHVHRLSFSGAKEGYSISLGTISVKRTFSWLTRL